MIWQNPWAWLGLLSLGLPVIIHLLGRGRTRVHQFPTLQFLPLSRLLPTKRTRLEDLILLVIRLGVLLAAVFALAQPLLLTAARQQHLDNTLSRAIIVDTSASMLRSVSTGESGIVVGDREASKVASEADYSVILKSGSASEAVAGASAWLARQSGRAELVVISDFQAGSISDADWASVPHDVGISLQRIDLSATPVVANRQERLMGGVMEALTTQSAGRTEVTWSFAPSHAEIKTTVLAGAGEARAVAAARDAAQVIAVPLPVDTSLALVIVYPGYERKDELLKSAKPLTTKWMTDVVARLAGDSLLASIAASARVTTDTPSHGALTVARTVGGTPVVLAAETVIGGRDQLLLFVLTDASSLTSAALIAATQRAGTLAPALTEQNPESIPDSALKSWQRAAAAAGSVKEATGIENEHSDGRWLWGVALALLALEAWIRRRPRTVEMVADAPA